MRSHTLLLLPLGLAALAGCADRKLATAAASQDGRIASTTPAPTSFANGAMTELPIVSDPGNLEESTATSVRRSRERRP